MPPTWVRPALAAGLAGLVLFLVAPAAAACALCDGGATGNPSRAAAFGPDLARHVAAAVAPFAVVGAVAAAVHFAPRRPRP